MDELSRDELRELARLTAELSERQQVFFQAAYWRLRRNPTTALVLCLLLGNFGAHYFYFGRSRGAVLRLLFCWTLIPWALALFEARSMPSRALRFNASLASELAVALKSAAPGISARPSEPAAATRSRRESDVRASTPLPEMADGAAAGRLASVVSSQLHARDDGVQPAPAPRAAVEPSERSAVAVGPDEPAGEPAEGAARIAAAIHEQPGDLADQADHTLPHAVPFVVAAAPTTPLAPITGILASDPERVETAPPTRVLDPWIPGPAANGDVVPPAEDGMDVDEIEGAWPGVALLGAAPILDRAAAKWGADEGARDEPRAVAAAAPQAVDGDIERWTRPLLGSDLDPGSQEHASWPGKAEDGPAAPPAADATSAAPDPVFMYQLETPTWRDSAHLAPPVSPLATNATHDAADSATAERSDLAFAGGSADTSNTAHEAMRESDASDGEMGDVALVGPVLASGLADLLRERRSRSLPRVAGELSQPAEAALLAPVDPAPRAPATPAVERMWQIAASDELPPMPWDGSYPAEASLHDDLPPIPAFASRDLHEAYNGIRESTSSAPAAAYVTTPSQRLRRRVVQRVIVRKMAVLDGRVVAESTVERQVPVVHNDAEMAERIEAATNDAAREALQHLIAQAPEEALPAIRMQLYALDNARSVDNFQGSGVITGLRTAASN